MRIRPAALVALAALVAAAAPAAAGTRTMELDLPIPPRLAVDGGERVHLGPFLLEPPSVDDARTLPVDLGEEFGDYVRRVLRRRTGLRLVPEVDARPSVERPDELIGATGFWRELGEEADADLILAASIDFQVLDRSGYRTERFVSPTDGQVYYRQVLIERTGYSADVLLMVFDGDTGELVWDEQIKDFEPKPERAVDELSGVFDRLDELEDRIVGLFVPRTIEAKRAVYR